MTDGRTDERTNLRNLRYVSFSVKTPTYVAILDTQGTLVLTDRHTSYVNLCV